MSLAGLSSSLGRFLAMSSAALIAVSACSALSAELALVPATAPPVRSVDDPRPTPSPSPVPSSVSSAVEEQAAEEVARQDRPRVKVRRLRPRPAAGPFKMNLYRKGDFVHQATKDWCVAGSTLTMMNIMDGGPPRAGSAMLRRLYLRGRDLSPYKRKLGPIGVDLIGWAELLNRRGYGPYEIAGADTMRGAIRRAAKAIRMTGRPVGLVTWRGAHSWVMSGFTATADPAFDGGFNVKAVYIQDTWYPWVSTIWGASRPPNTLVAVPRLAEDYLPYARPGAKWPRRDGRYMLILPVLPKGTIAR